MNKRLKRLLRRGCESQVYADVPVRGFTGKIVHHDLKMLGCELRFGHSTAHRYTFYDGPMTFWLDSDALGDTLPDRPIPLAELARVASPASAPVSGVGEGTTE